MAPAEMDPPKIEEVETAGIAANEASAPNFPPRPRPGALKAVERLAGLFALGGTRTGKTALSASVWSAAGYGTLTVLRFASRLVLARLVPNAAPMGDVAIILLILGGLEMISDLGIGVGIVQHRLAAERIYLGTAFSVQAIRGLGIWAIAALMAFPIAWIYHAPALTGLLLFGSLSTLFKALMNPGVWLHTRHMTLRIPTLLTISSELAGFLVTIAWILISPSAWAIVSGVVVSAAVYSAASHLVGPRAVFLWDRKVAREIINFGGWMVLSSATYFLSSRGESLMLRGSVPDIEFGCFAFASMLVTTPVAATTALASQVFLPMLASAVRESEERARRLYRFGKWAFTALALAFVWGAVFVAPPAIALLKLRPTFAGLAWMVPLLGLRSALDIFGLPSSSLLFASGAPRYATGLNVGRLFMLVGGLYLTVGRWGLHGAIWVLIGAGASSYLILLPGIRRHMANGMPTEVATLIVFWVGSAGALALRAAF